MNLELLAAGAGVVTASSAAFNALVLLHRGFVQRRRRPAALALALLSGAAGVQGALGAAGPAGPLGDWPSALPALRTAAALALTAGSLLISALLLRPSLSRRFLRWPR